MRMLSSLVGTGQEVRRVAVMLDKPTQKKKVDVSTANYKSRNPAVSWELFCKPAGSCYHEHANTCYSDLLYAVCVPKSSSQFFSSNDLSWIKKPLPGVAGAARPRYGWGCCLLPFPPWISHCAKRRALQEKESCCCHNGEERAYNICIVQEFNLFASYTVWNILVYWLGKLGLLEPLYFLLSSFYFLVVELPSAVTVQHAR